jgi:hypothetical protein
LLATIEDRFNLAPLNQRDAHATSYADLFSDMNIARQGFHYDRENSKITQDVVVTNMGRKAVQGPIELVLNDLSAGSALLNASGQTADKTPYLLVDNSRLEPNGALKVTLEFSLPENGGISYHPIAVQQEGGSR